MLERPPRRLCQLGWCFASEAMADDVDCLVVGFAGVKITLERNSSSQKATGSSAPAPSPASGKAQPQAKPEVSPSSSSVDPGASSIAYHPGTRFYAVVYWPERPELEGLWEGPHPKVWNALEAELPGKKLPGSGVRLRRVDSPAHGLKVWTEAKAKSRLLSAMPVIEIK